MERAYYGPILSGLYVITLFTTTPYALINFIQMRKMKHKEVK